MSVFVSFDTPAYKRHFFPYNLLFFYTHANTQWPSLYFFLYIFYYIYADILNTMNYTNDDDLLYVSRIQSSISFLLRSLHIFYKQFLYSSYYIRLLSDFFLQEEYNRLCKSSIYHA